MVTDDVFLSGDSVDVYDYTALSGYYYKAADNKEKVLGYSKLAEKVYRSGGTRFIPAYSAYDTTVYTAGTKRTITNYTKSTAYYRGAGSATLYPGDGGYIVGRGNPISGTKQGTQMSVQYYYSSTYGSNYGKMTKRQNPLYAGGAGYSGYAGDGSAGYLRGTGSTYYLREATHGDVYVVSSTEDIVPVGTKITTQLYTRDTSRDITVNLQGTEYPNVYERDEDSDYEYLSVNASTKVSGLYQKSDSYSTIRKVGQKVVFTPAEVKTQVITALIN